VSSLPARLIVFFAAVQIIGGHWLAIQSVAWVGMIANYARGENLVVAIERTFDGQHPCSLCKVVKIGREQEQKQHVAQVIVKLDAVLATTTALPAPQASDWQYSVFLPVNAARSLAPPTPPPLA
jgi:hypothetical protein